MLTQSERLAPVRRLQKRRLWLIQLFVAGTMLLVIVVVAYLWLRPRHAGAAPTLAAQRAPDVRAEPSRSELEPRVNEYEHDNHYVLEVLVPGADPKVCVLHDHLARGSTLTLSWTPAATNGDTKKRCGRQEWQPTAFVRTLLLPEGLGTPQATLKDGVLTLSFPRRQPVTENIIPTKAR